MGGVSGTPLRKMLRCRGYFDPVVPGFLPDGPDRRGKMRVGNRAQCNADGLGVLFGRPVHTCPANWTEEGSELAATVSNSDIFGRMAADFDIRPGIINSHAKWGSGPALAGFTVTGDDSGRHALGQDYPQASTRAVGVHVSP